jgi:hypothetical protein
MSGRVLSKLTLVHVLLALTSVALVPNDAAAQGPGARGGVSIDPDQVYFGAHYETGALVDRVFFKPNVEVGLGSDVTLVGLNFEFVYKFPERNQWQLYAGAGPAVNFYSFDRGPDDDRESNSEPGINFLIGVEHSRGLFFEFKIGAIDSPELKVGVGWTFR